MFQRGEGKTFPLIHQSNAEFIVNIVTTVVVVAIAVAAAVVALF